MLQYHCSPNRKIMLKEIKYNGFTATPSDYECPDGDLATLINLVPEDGTLQPVKQPLALFTLPSGYTVFFIHEGTDYKHYVIRNGQSLYWIDEPAQGDTLTTSDFTPDNLLQTFTPDIYGINAVGNTLIVLTSDGMHYILWKGNNNKYKYLGAHFPELPISFGLQGKVKHSDTFTISNKSDCTEEILAKVNLFIAENQTNSGRFILPFFVRYAYRLYDQSLTMHSAPVLMVASAGCAPNVLCTQAATNFGTCEVVAIRSYLDYAVTSASNLAALKEWKDIISSVDVFISAPIYTYDQNGKCEGTVGVNNIESYYGDLYSVYLQNDQSETLSPSSYPLRYQKKSLQQSLIMECGGNTIIHDNTTFNYFIRLPQKSYNKVKEEIRDCSLFYFLKSFKLDELSTERTTIEIEDGYLQSLVNREVMTDDYDSHDQLLPKLSFGYNSRMNFANIEKSLYDGYPSMSITPYTNGKITYFTDGSSPSARDATSEMQVFVFIRQDGKDIVVSNRYEGVVSMYFLPIYLYYPNINAYKAVIRTSWGYGYRDVEIQLEKHNNLNGSFYFNGWDSPNTESTSDIAVSNDKTVSLPNKIYTSEVNNPFYFPVLGINTVGTGTILGICAAVKALSQGQFGQFPLYAFTTEGVWALEVSSEGKYTARQPVTRDVCTNANSITQLDNAVLFVTDRGVMLISGSNSQCITDTLDAEAVFSLSSLQGLSSVCGNTIAASVPEEDFRTFLASARMLYDYTNQRIIIYNPSRQYAYVYSLKSKLWGMMQSDIVSGINSYPETLALDNNNTVVSLSESEQGGITDTNGLVITRPLKLDAPDILKTVDTIVQRGYFRKGHVKSILYGSRDLFNWHLIYSSNDHYLRGFRGTPYKFFRIALVCNLAKEESIFGCTVQFTPRYLNQPR